MSLAKALKEIRDTHPDAVCANLFVNFETGHVEFSASNGKVEPCVTCHWTGKKLLLEEQRDDRA